MRIFFDTSVLVAGSVGSHVHHLQAHQGLRRIIEGRDTGLISAHSIAEVFSALTRIPVVPRIHPAEASRIIAENLLPHFEIVPLHKNDYLTAMRVTVESGWSGGKIYDALLLCCAARANADRIYTFNLHDFEMLAPTSLAGKICRP